MRARADTSSSSGRVDVVAGLSRPRVICTSLHCVQHSNKTGRFKEFPEGLAATLQALAFPPSLCEHLPSLLQESDLLAVLANPAV